MKKDKQKIAVGISGGVDSSVAAYLLKKEGHDVIGIFIKTWSPEWLPCTWVDEKRDAMRVCAKLDIPFYFLDAEEGYKKGVAEYMITEYRAGRTPNPDVLCNRVIKFGVLWEYAKKLGVDAIATGHYARVVSRDELVVSSDKQKQTLLATNYYLLTGIDRAKDQSYFLWMLSKEELSHILFPIGHLQKDEVREIARKAELFTSKKKDSQGICFLGDVDMREFLSHYIQQRKGEVISEEGKVIGEHDGVWFYTIGERHGFRITSKDSQRVPQYVIGKDVEKNVLIVSPKMIQSVSEGKEVLVSLRDSNWIIKPNKNTTYKGQFRYHGAFYDAIVQNENTVRLKYEGGLPLGQSLVVYDGDILVGGGIIDMVV